MLCICTLSNIKCRSKKCNIVLEISLSFYQKSAEEKCSHCERMLECPPITLPCNDVVCDGCYEDVKAFGKYECAKCHQIVPPGFRFERREDGGYGHFTFVALLSIFFCFGRSLVILLFSI
jgi:hypothetical protein